MFIKLVNSTNNKPMRINVNEIVAYTRKRSDIDGQEHNYVYLTSEPGVILTNESPEELDAILTSCYVTVKT